MSVALKPREAHVWARGDLDWYVEPEWATEALLSVERFVGPVLDPCCGQGNIVRALNAAGVLAWGSDLVDRTDGETWFYGEADFLTERSAGQGRPAANIVMNPPFFRAKGAEAFIRQALAIASGKVCAFVDVKFLAGGARGLGLWAEHPPTRVWILSNRPSCPPGEHLEAGGKATGGTADWCWLVWDLTAPAGETRLGWLRRAR